MGFITKNANMILLFLIMLSAASLVGATVFFQMNFEKINTEYNQKVQQLQVISKDLQIKQALLDKIKGELTIKTERETQLGEKFTEVKTDKEQLETQKAALESTKEHLTAELETTESSLRSTQSELEAKKDVITTLQNDNDKLSVQLDVCGDQRDDYKDDKNACVAAKALCTCP
jgi:chromosome segregation ATPase